MERTWLVGLDGSDDARHALDWALAIAGPNEDAVQPVVTWFVPIPIMSVAGRRPLDVDRAGLEATANVVASHAVEDVDPGRAVLRDPMVIEGHPADALLELADGEQPIVVGRRGVSALRHRFLGSTSHDLVVHPTTPVVVVPAGVTTTDLRRIVVGFDGSDHAEAALRWAMDVAPPDTIVESVAAIDVVPWLQPEIVMQRHADDVEAERARLDEALDRIDPDGRVERTTVLHGPYQALAESFDRADLIVVGPRGLGAVSRLILGSITSWLLHEVPCPIAVVPTP